MTKQAQYNEYLTWGGTMTMEEWENDCRYDKSLEPNPAEAHTPKIKELEILLADERDPVQIQALLSSLAELYQTNNL